ncbi:hypothetical protein HOS53_gp030 [Klebsiella phage May]|uniref:Uncharacterized protein n=1 Tax=Klebsiella phage May TaxID=2054272 RepID=A0A2H5BP66_9CAUD|nr:hypothetical protein HOS53_gp030 [Klebsiella phage May]AUG88130.1 hypothetical protein CPT_May_216 [Klebsiella phage May]
MMNKRGFGLFFFMCYSGYNPPVTYYLIYRNANLFTLRMVVILG